MTSAVLCLKFDAASLIEALSALAQGIERLVELPKCLVEFPDLLSEITLVELGRDATGRADELVILLKPTEALLSLVSALGAGEGGVGIVEDATHRIVPVDGLATATVDRMGWDVESRPIKGGGR